MLIESRASSDPELAALLVAQRRELGQADGGPAGQAFVPHDDARYLVGVLAGRAVACGAIQTLDRDTAEVNRMYVRPAHRGQGLARQLLGALEELALRTGHTVLRLETGSHLPAAIQLCLSSGYTEIPAYGEYTTNPYSVCFEKPLPEQERLQERLLERQPLPEQERLSELDRLSEQERWPATPGRQWRTGWAGATVSLR